MKKSYLILGLMLVTFTILIAIFPSKAYDTSTTPTTSPISTTTRTSLEGMISSEDIKIEKIDSGYVIWLHNNLLDTDLDVSFDGVYKGKIPKYNGKWFDIDDKIKSVVVKTSDYSEDKKRSWYRDLREEDWPKDKEHKVDEKYFLHIIKDKITDIDPNREGIQVKGTIEIPYEYVTSAEYPKTASFHFDNMWFGGGFLEPFYEIDTEYGDTKLSKNLYKGASSIRIATHLATNGIHKIVIEGRGGSDQIFLYFDNLNEIDKLSFESTYSKGILDFHPKMDIITLENKFSQIYEKMLDLGYPKEKIKKVEVEFVGLERYQDELIDFCGKGDAVKWGGKCISEVIDVKKRIKESLKKPNPKDLLKYGNPIFKCALEYVVGEATVFVLEEASKATQPSIYLKYSNMPQGDLAGNRYGIFVTTEDIAYDYTNAQHKIRVIYPFFLNLKGDWAYLGEQFFKIENEYIWKGIGVDCIEWIEKPDYINEGVARNAKLKIKADVLPNIYSKSMRLEIDVPVGLEISNLRIKSPSDEAPRSQDFVKVDVVSTGIGYSYGLSDRNIIKGDKTELGSCARAIININSVEDISDKIEISFDIKANKKGTFEVKYGLVPQDRIAGDYSRVVTKEYPNPIIDTDPAQTKYYYYRYLENNFKMDATSEGIEWEYHIFEPGHSIS